MFNKYMRRKMESKQTTRREYWEIVDYQGEFKNSLARLSSIL